MLDQIHSTEFGVAQCEQSKVDQWGNAEGTAEVCMLEAWQVENSTFRETGARKFAEIRSSTTTSAGSFNEQRIGGA